jgi:hypothetical protein
MNLGPQPVPAPHDEILRIAAGADVARRDLAGALLRMRAGRIWLTQHGDIRDYVYAAGEAARVDRDGPVVIQALEDTEIAIERPAPGRARLARFLSLMPWNRGSALSAAAVARTVLEPARRWRFAAGAHPACPQ